MDVSDLLREAYGRVPDLVRGALDGLTQAQLREAPAAGANPIGWTVWHLIRVQDHHLGEVMDVDQLWLADGWAGRFGRAAERDDTGYGHGPDDVAGLDPVSGDLLLAYLDAVHARTVGYLAGLEPKDLDRVVDERWDPPVTLGVRLVSIADDEVQHGGQANYARGMLLGG